MSVEPEDIEPIWLMCALGGGVPRIPGSLPDRCQRCNRSIWIAPTGQRRLSDGVVNALICTACFLADDELANGDRIPEEQDQIAEIVNAIKMNNERTRESHWN